jgi:hypothetical protein
MQIMSRDKLLARQDNVIHALTAGDRVAGIDPARVEFVSELARAKRIAKIQSVLPRTCRALGEHFVPMARNFVFAYAPTSFRSLADGLKFYWFLGRRRTTPVLLDLAYCELAMSVVAGPLQREQTGSISTVSGETLAVRRAPGVRLRRCRFDVRAMFEGEASEISATCPEIPTCLAILADPLAGTPRIVRLSPGLFDFLRALRAWEVVPTAADTNTKQFLDQLGQRGLLEISSRIFDG